MNGSDMLRAEDSNYPLLKDLYEIELVTVQHFIVYYIAVVYIDVFKLKNPRVSLKGI